MDWSQITSWVIGLLGIVGSLWGGLAVWVARRQVVRIDEMATKLAELDKTKAEGAKVEAITLLVAQIQSEISQIKGDMQRLPSLDAFRTVVTDNVNPLDGDIKELSSRFHELNISIAKLEERDRLTKLIEGLTRDGK